MPTFTLDGKELTVEQGTTVLKAALANGVQIPHFCFHPHLSVDGSCRMCQVEVEKMPKLAISCDTLVADGMVVKTTSEKVLKARNAVMEYLLLNHPLDCPICDQAGECGLQEYNFKHWMLAVIEQFGECKSTTMMYRVLVGTVNLKNTVRK